MRTSFLKYIPILLTMIIWGSMGIPSTYAMAEFTPMSLLCVRSGIGAVILLPYVKLRYGSIFPAKEDYGTIVIMGIVGVVLCNYLYFYAVQNTSLTNVAILYAVGPIMTTVLAFFILKEPVKQSRVLGVALAFGGAVALVVNGDIQAVLQMGFQAGDIAELASALCLAVYTILSKGIRRTQPVCVVLWMMLVSTVVTIPVVLMQGGFPTQLSMAAIGGAVYLGVLCSGFGYLLQQRSIQLIGASSSAAFLYGVSPITIFTAAVILGETISLVQFCAMAVVFLGVYCNAKNMSFVKK